MTRKCEACSTTPTQLLRCCARPLRDCTTPAAAVAVIAATLVGCQALSLSPPFPFPLCCVNANAIPSNSIGTSQPGQPAVGRGEKFNEAVGAMLARSAVADLSVASPRGAGHRAPSAPRGSAALTYHDGRARAARAARPPRPTLG